MANRWRKASSNHERIVCYITSEVEKFQSFRFGTILAIAGLMINLALTVLWQLEIFAFEDQHQQMT
jgi:hypothetical protein